MNERVTSRHGMLRVHIVALAGALESHTTGWRDVLRDVEGEAVFIDLSGVTMISAAFVGELARLRKRLPAARIKTIGLSSHHRRVLDLLHVEEMLALPTAV